MPPHTIPPWPTKAGWPIPPKQRISLECLAPVANASLVSGPYWSEKIREFLAGYNPQALQTVLKHELSIPVQKAYLLNLELQPKAG